MLWFKVDEVTNDELPNILGKIVLIADRLIDGSGVSPNYRIAQLKEDDEDKNSYYWDAEMDQQYTFDEFLYFAMIDGPTESQIRLVTKSTHG